MEMAQDQRLTEKGRQVAREDSPNGCRGPDTASASGGRHFDAWTVTSTACFQTVPDVALGPLWPHGFKFHQAVPTPKPPFAGASMQLRRPNGYHALDRIVVSGSHAPPQSRPAAPSRAVSTRRLGSSSPTTSTAAVLLPGTSALARTSRRNEAKLGKTWPGVGAKPVGNHVVLAHHQAFQLRQNSMQIAPVDNEMGPLGGHTGYCVGFRKAHGRNHLAYVSTSLFVVMVLLLAPLPHAAGADGPVFSGSGGLPPPAQRPNSRDVEPGGQPRQIDTTDLRAPVIGLLMLGSDRVGLCVHANSLRSSGCTSRTAAVASRSPFLG